MPSSRWPTRSAWRAVATRCSAVTTSTSPRIAPSCTPRCGSRRTRPSRSTGRTSSADVHDVLHRVYEFADKVRSGAWTGVTGKRISTVVNIGIGGSDLGPVMAYEALAAYRQDGLECRFISNIDPTDAATTLAGSRPGDDPLHRRQQDVRDPRDAHQRPAVPVLAARRVWPTATRRTPSPSTSSPCPPPSTRSPTSGSTPPTPSGSGTGSAVATPSTPRSAPRWSSRSGRSGSPSSWPDSTPWTSTSAPRRPRRTSRC